MQGQEGGTPARIEFRPARPENAPDLSELRCLSKGFWGYPKEALEAWRPAMQVAPQYLCTHLVNTIHRDGRLVGFYALVEGDPSELDHLWLHPEAIGQGIGHLALVHACCAARARGISRLRIVSDVYAESFYLRHGARRCGKFYSPVQNRELPVLELDTSLPEGLAPRTSEDIGADAGTEAGK
jgi:GNAT superfamily N-acetyltransferase